MAEEEMELKLFCGKCGETTDSGKWKFDCVPSDSWVKWASVECPCGARHKIQGRQSEMEKSFDENGRRQ